jgi:hypothetical protein
MKMIITEDQQKLVSSKLHDMIKKYGIKIASKSVGGSKNLLKILNINSPMDFLHLFDDFDFDKIKHGIPIRNLTFFRYRPNNILLIYNRKKREIYVNYDDIWSVLSDNFELEYSEIQKLLKIWLDKTFNLKDVTPSLNNNFNFNEL